MLSNRKNKEVTVEHRCSGEAGAKLRTRICIGDYPNHFNDVRVDLHNFAINTAKIDYFRWLHRFRGSVQDGGDRWGVERGVSHFVQ